MLAFAAACGSVSEPDPPDDRPPCTGQPVNVLQNGAFDAAEPAWRQEPANLLCGNSIIPPDTPAMSACLGGGRGGTATHTLSLDVALPEGATSARLTGKICISTDHMDAIEHDAVTFELLDGVAPFASLGRKTNVGATSVCTFTNFMLEAALDRDPPTATFRVQSKLESTAGVTSFFLDTLELVVACR